MKRGKKRNTQRESQRAIHRERERQREQYVIHRERQTFARPLERESEKSGEIEKKKTKRR